MLEQELKLAVDGSFVPAIPPEGSEVGAIEELPALDLRATYYDTPDLRLARHGVTLRNRIGDTEEGGAWTVKLPVGDGIAEGRDEISFEGAGRTVPPAAADLVRALVRSSTLTPVARLRTRRRRWRLRDPEGGELAEMVDDRVSVLQSGRVSDRFREIEIEGRGIDHAALERIAQIVTRNGVGSAEQIPKLVRALGRRAQAPPDVVVPARIRPRDPAAVAVRAAIGRGVRRIMLNDARTRLGEPEPLHQMRVGTRRLRSDLRTFRDLLDPEWVRTMRSELKWLGAALGDVRDLDVMLERLGAAGQDLEPRLNDLLGELEAQHEVARERLLGALRSQRYVNLLDRLVEAAAAPPLTAAADLPAEEALPPLARRAWRRVRGPGRKLDGKSPDTDFHEVRKRAKQARYAAEAVAPALGSQRGREARRFAKRAADVQGVLGELQDAVVAEETIERFVAGDDERPHEVHFAAGRLLERQHAARRDARRGLGAAWRKLDCKKRRRWM
jgi:CHAD domain-containing protein